MIRLIPRYKMYLSWKIFWLILKKILTGKFFKGKSVSEFEKNFKDYIGVKQAIATPTASTALYLLLKSFDLKQGDEVLVSVYNASEVISMIIYAGLKPVFVDIETDTYNMDPVDAEKKISDKTKVIILTHLFGQPCQIDNFLILAREHNLITIEDCAQASGAKYHGKKVGTFGQASYFSFNSYKNITTFFGGMITTNNDLLADKLRKSLGQFPLPKTLFILKRITRDFILHLASSKVFFPLTYLFVALINKYDDTLIEKLVSTRPALIKELPKHYLTKYTNVQAAVGLEQMSRLEEQNKKRIAKVKIYYSKLSDQRNFKLPKQVEGAGGIYLNLAVRSKDSKIIIKKLFKKGIDLTRGNIYLVSGLEIFKDYHLDCPKAKMIKEEIFYLPLHPSYSQKDINYVIERLKNI